MATGGRAVLLVGPALLLATLTGSQPATRADGPAAPTAAAGTTAVVDTFRSTRSYDAVAVPVRLRIPAARIDTVVRAVGRSADGAIAVPDSPHLAAWYEEGPRPGQRGPAVIVGHVDSQDGPGVFFHLAELPRGAVIHVDAADGTTVTFRVTGLSRVPKSRFPTDLVYSPTLQPSLHLVTCGGGFDHATGSYRDNVIVYAAPT
jgi:sortase (surface protein transpeptidase)